MNNGCYFKWQVFYSFLLQTCLEGDAKADALLEPDFQTREEEEDS